MEARIQVLSQVIDVRYIVADLEAEETRPHIQQTKAAAQVAIQRFSDAEVASQEDITALQQKYADYEAEMDDFLTSYDTFAQARAAFEANADKLVMLGIDMEEMADSALEGLERTPTKEITWRGELHNLWDAADGGMETYISLLQQFYYLEQLEDGADFEVTQEAIAQSLDFQVQATARMIESGMFDVPAGSDYPGQTMAEAYQALLDTHETLLADYLEELQFYVEAQRAYDQDVADFLALLVSVEDVGDHAVEGEVETIEATQQTASTVMSITLGVGLMAALIVAFVLTRSITAPVGLVTEAARQIAVGDVNQSIDYQSGDEIGEMADAFRRMVAYQQAMARAADHLAEGDLAVDVTPQSERDILGNAFRRMMGYLRAMADVADRLAQGDLTAEVRPASSQDVLGNAFVQMITSLRQLVGQVQRSATQVATTSQEINMATEQSAQATGQVAATMQQIAQGTTQQAESVTRAVATVDQVSRAIDGVASGAQEQAVAVTRSAEITAQMSTAIQQVAANAQAGTAGASEATRTAQAGARTIEQTIEGMQVIRDKVGLSVQSVQEMGKRSEQIGMIVETIDDVASQTNLLALNAAIEAARAGEHGKGFAVVAEEVRKLAESSTQATKEIAALVKGIQQTVADAVRTMEEGAAEVETGVTRAGESAQALNSILRAIEAVNQQVDEIAVAAEQMSGSADEMVSAMDSVSAIVEENTASTEEMAAGASQVSTSIEDIASISEENSAASEEVSAAVEEVSAQAQEVTASVESLSGMAQDLQALVARFKLPDDWSK
jgi:methyl-accepting chemotaxis protein